MPRCHIALGGNLGPVAEHVGHALALLDATPGTRVARVSDLFRTAPVGEHAGDPFLNAAAELESSLPPLPLLDRLQQIEQQLGRVRTRHWGPRTIDLDLILYGSEIIGAPRLRVPHPACWYRRFVLDPLCQIAGDVLHPIKGVTFDALRSRLPARPLPLAVAGGAPTERAALITELGAEFPDARCEEWPALADPAILACLDPCQIAGLPDLPRLDVPPGSNPRAFLADVLRAALDEPQRQTK